MPRPGLGYLHKNRHGTFAFRWCPPRELAPLFDQPIHAVSLGTKCREAAWRAALRPTLRLHALIELIRVKPPKKQLIDTGLIRRFVHADGQATEVDYDASNAADVTEANRVFREVMQGGATDAGQLATLDAAVAPPPATEQAGQGRGGLTISAAFKRFCMAPAAR